MFNIDISERIQLTQIRLLVGQHYFPSWVPEELFAYSQATDSPIHWRYSGDLRQPRLVSIAGRQIEKHVNPKD